MDSASQGSENEEHGRIFLKRRPPNSKSSPADEPPPRELDGSESAKTSFKPAKRWIVVSRKARQAESQVRISPREQDIYRLVAKGQPNKSIAASLGISTWTVSSYLKRLFVKFNVNSRAALVASLMEAGVSPGAPVRRRKPHPGR